MVRPMGEEHIVIVWVTHANLVIERLSTFEKEVFRAGTEANKVAHIAIPTSSPEVAMLASWDHVASSCCQVCFSRNHVVGLRSAPKPMF